MSDSQQDLTGNTLAESKALSSLSLTPEERSRANLSNFQEKSFISSIVKVVLLLFVLAVAYLTAVFTFARASLFCGPALLPLLLVLGAAVYLVMTKKRQPAQAPSKIISFAAATATDVLSSNWDNVDYYSRLYVYASPELASHMHSKRQLLNRVLDERAELLGDFVDIEGLELRMHKFRLIPAPVMEVTGTLRCSKATVPIIILINATKTELTLDGIKILKRELTPIKGSTDAASAIEKESSLELLLPLSSAEERLQGQCSDKSCQEEGDSPETPARRSSDLSDR